MGHIRLPPFSCMYCHRNVGRCFPRVNLKNYTFAPETIISNGKLRPHSRCVSETVIPIALCNEFQDFAIGPVTSNIYDVSLAILKQGPPSRDNLPFYYGDVCG